MVCSVPDCDETHNPIIPIIYGSPGYLTILIGIIVYYWCNSQIDCPHDTNTFIGEILFYMGGSYLGMILLIYLLRLCCLCIQHKIKRTIVDNSHNLEDEQSVSSTYSYSE